MIQRLLSLILFIAVLPVILIVSFILLLSQGFPIYFFQTRVGRNKKLFTIYKFRTMHNGQITKVGKVLRKTGIDELLQLVNIIKGEMSFVGPRPLTETDIERLDWNQEEYSDRWSILPGITGPAQLVNVCDKNVSMKNDLQFARNKTTKLSLKYIFLSASIPFIGKEKVKNKIHAK